MRPIASQDDSEKITPQLKQMSSISAVQGMAMFQN
jgi:hypothetical protein